MTTGGAADAAIRTALEHYGAGRLHDAEDVLRRAVGSGGDTPGLHTSLGVVLIGLQRTGEAVASFERALVLDPEFADARYNLGNTLGRSGDPRAAAGHLRAAIRARPDHAEARVDLAIALLGLDEGDEAVELLRAALEIAPEHDRARDILADVLVERGAMADAERLYRKILDDRPDDVEALDRLGVVHLALGRREDALAQFRRAIEVSPGHAGVHAHLGHALADIGDHHRAHASYARALAADAGHRGALAGLANLKSLAGDLDGAIADYRHLLSRGAATPVIHVRLGDALRDLDRVEEATEQFHLALVSRPSDRDDRAAIIHAAKEIGGEAERARLEEMLRRAAMSEPDRADAHLALATIYHARAMTDAAFENFRAGNAIKSRLSSYDPVRHERYVDAIIATFDKAHFAARKDWGAASELPVFIVGMPRSGTTLVEQILASHHRVFGAGELEQVDRAAGAAAGYPESVRDWRPDDAIRIGEGLLGGLAARGGDAARIIDKAPLNFHHLGLIATALPGARVIHCRRDPLDTCLSCYVTSFTADLGFTCDLGHLGAYWRDCRRLMAHWRAVLPVAIHDIQYEDLVADLEGEARRLVAFLGLEWSAACLEYHRNRRPVRTASTQQVRQPIHARSIGRAKAYAAYLAPLVEALGDAE